MDMFKTIKDTLSVIELVDSSGIIESLRAVKDREEIKLIEEASRIAGKAYEHILDFFKVGVKEKDIALEFEFFMRKSGVDGLAFDLILVSGGRTTHEHGAPSEKKINNGDFVIIDFGALYKGYRCDITRTFVVGQATAKQKDIYYTVKKAQQKGLDLLKAGFRGKNVCVEARKIIEDAGYGDYNNGYGLGHGVGLEIHEDPYIRSYGELIFEEGHVVTVEPGIYIPGWGGVRIEDTVVIEKNSCKVLTNLPKDLVEL
jgi:Xaa-Pro aminopeptidase